MTIKEKITKVIDGINPKLERIGGARMDLVNVDDEKSEVFIRVEAKKNTC